MAPAGRVLRALLALGAFLVGAAAPALGGAAPAEGTARTVLVTRVSDPITPVVAEHLKDTVMHAERGRYHALIVEIDTPGGLESAMRDIVQDFLGANVPVVTFVSPSGARAASAGALIAWSSHIVAMAPGTTIGAATPVALEGGEVGDKIVQDSASYARAVAEERGRNVEVAEAAVTEGRSLSASEALDENVADLIVGDRAELLRVLDGREVALPHGVTRELHTADAVVEERQMSFFRRLLQRLADPNLAFLFMSIGTLGIIYELATPGVGLAGGIGVLLLLLALFSLAVLPIDAVGLIFFLLAGVLFVAELFAPGVGIAAALGSVSLALGGVFLFRDTPGLTLSLVTVLPTVAVVGGAVIIAGRLAMRTRHAPAWTGAATMAGREIVVARASGQTGQGHLDGSWWNLRSDGAPLREGERMRVREMDGLDLVVEPLASQESEANP